MGLNCRYIQKIAIDDVMAGRDCLPVECSYL